MSGIAIARRRLRALWAKESRETRQVAWVDPSTLTFSAPTQWDSPVPSWRAMQVPAVHAAVTMISDHIGGTGWSSWRDTEQVAPTPTILRRPDPFTTVEAFRHGAAASLLLEGAAIFLLGDYGRDGRPTRAQLLPPAEVAVSWNETRTRRRFRWRSGDYTEWPEGRAGRQILYVPAFVLPNDPLIGYGPTWFARATINEALAQDAYARDYFAKGTVTDGVISVPGVMLKDEVARLRAQWDTDQAGRRGPPILTAGASFTQNQFNNRNAQFLESRAHVNTDIARAYGVPAALLNAVVAGSASLVYRNQEQIWIEYTRTALLPIVDRLAASFSQLLPSTQEVRFHLDDLQRADIESRARAYASLISSRVYTENEARALEGLAPLPGRGPVPSDPELTDELAELAPVLAEEIPDA